MIPPGIIGGLGLVAAASAVSVIAPRRLLRLSSGAEPGPGLTRRLAVICAGAGGVMLLGSASLAGLADAVLLALLTTVLTATALIDARYLVIPDLHPAMIALIGLLGPTGLVGSLWGALLGGGLLWLVREAYGRARGVEGLGLGDVKLVAAIGVVVGPLYVLWVIVGGAVLGLVWAALGPKAGDRRTPFGSALAAPAVLVAFMAMTT
jgi:leader peptidase (prepilin peptidase)/N-methyltransferase